MQKNAGKESGVSLLLNGGRYDAFPFDKKSHHFSDVKAFKTEERRNIIKG